MPSVFSTQALVGGLSLESERQQVLGLLNSSQYSSRLLNGSSLKLVDKFTYQGSCVSSTETDINTQLAKAWTAINRLSVIWKSDLTDKIKRSFFQAVVSILLYGCTT